MHRSVGIVALLVASGGAAASNPYLVKNIQTFSSVGSNPGSSFTVNSPTLGDVAVFPAMSNFDGIELWRTDGTAAGTVLVKDINPGSGNGVPSTLSGTNSIQFAGKLLFVADDGGGNELWVTDGTEAGTVKLIDLDTDGFGSGPQNFVEFAGEVYFSADSSVDGRELYKTDGTPAGTVLVKDIYPGIGGFGPNNSSPSNFRVVGAQMFFTASDANGTELWVTDGTAAGTANVLDINPGATGSSPANLTVFGSSILFSANDGVNGTELWGSDGTAAGTQLLLDAFPGSSFNSGSPNNITVAGSNAFFTATSGFSAPGLGTELYITDGTPAGTALVLDIRPGTSGSNPSNLTPVGSQLFFRADDGVVGNELWVSDGTASGTTLVEDIFVGTAFSSSFPSNLTEQNGKLFFTANSGTSAPGTGTEPWISDGTPAGTFELVDAVPGTGSSLPSTGRPFGLPFYQSAGDLYFVSSSAGLWKTDGTAPGTVQLSAVSGAGSITPVGSDIFFVGNDGVLGSEVYVSDGTPAGTMLVADVNLGSFGSNPSNLSEFGGSLFFSGDTGDVGREPRFTDGTSAGTALLRDIKTGDNGAAIGEVVALDDGVFFRATDQANGQEPWFSDGTDAGTFLLADVRPGSTGSNPSNVRSINGSVYFQANDGVTGAEPYVSDGTSAGTGLLKDVNAGVSGSNATDFIGIGAGVLFEANDGATGNEWHETDGTTAGTMLLADLVPGGSFDSVNPANAAAIDGKLYFSGSSALGTELYVYDPAAAPGSEFTLINVNATFTAFSQGSSTPNHFTELNGLVYFSADDGLEGRELFVTDGTDPGTARVKDIYPGGFSASFRNASTPSELTVYNGELYFAANDGVVGIELWKSDGTDAGTTLVDDIWPSGTASSNPTSLVVLGSNLYFIASDGTTGNELFRYDGVSVSLVKDINPGSTGGIGFGARLFRVGNALFFFASDGVNGTELWTSDGTSAGTVMVADLNPGPGSGVSTGVTPAVANGLLFFAGDDGINGNPELFAYDLCVGDWNGDGQASVGDVLDFLGAWSAGVDPRADINGDGQYSVGDILDFLAIWSAGCP